MSHLRFSSLIIAMAATLVGVAGCASDRVSGLRAPPPLAARAVTAAGRAVSCPFIVASIEDVRAHDSLGAVGATLVDGNGFARWFSDGMAAVPGYGEVPSAVVLRIVVLKAYIQSLGTLKSANIVVSVGAISREGAAHAEKMYRGVDNSTNWSSSQSEVQDAFDSALNHLTQQIAADLPGFCGRQHG